MDGAAGGMRMISGIMYTAFHETLPILTAKEKRKVLNPFPSYLLQLMLEWSFTELSVFMKNYKCNNYQADVLS